MRSRYLIKALGLTASVIAISSLQPANAQLFNFNNDQATQAQQVEAQMNMRINQLEGQIRLLNGQVESYENRIRRMEDAQKRFQEDVDFRFKDLEASKTGPNNGSGGAISQPKKPSDAPNAQIPNAQIQAPVTPAPIVQAPAANDTLKDSGAAALAAMKAKDSATTPTTPSTSSAKDAYDLAYGYHVRGDNELAESSFKNFLKTHPNDVNAGNAQFWLGETQFARKKYKESADSFLTSYQKYPNGAKATDSLLKLGMSLSRLNAKPEACGTFAEVAKKYPRASNSIKAKLTAEQKLANCG